MIDTLEHKVKSAVLDLHGFTGSSAFLLPVSGTTPQIYVVSGTKKQITAMLRHIDDGPRVAANDDSREATNK